MNFANAQIVADGKATGAKRVTRVFALSEAAGADELFLSRYPEATPAGSVENGPSTSRARSGAEHELLISV